MPLPSLSSMVLSVSVRLPEKTYTPWLSLLRTVLLVMVMSA